MASGNVCHCEGAMKKRNMPILSFLKCACAFARLDMKPLAFHVEPLSYVCIRATITWRALYNSAVAHVVQSWRPHLRENQEAARGVFTSKK